jgi:GNAT superfamily N-acetyltransferase
MNVCSHAAPGLSTPQPKDLVKDLPASETSLRVTEAYRRRIFAVRTQLESRAESLWPDIRGLDDFNWTNRMAAATQQAQKDAVGATGAYLSAFLTSEVGQRTRGPILDTRRYSGLSRDGRPLRDALRSPMIGVRAKLAEGSSPQDALAYGLNRAKRMVSVDYDHAHRTALLDGLAADERFAGWQRAVTGTCGACAGDIAVEVSTNLPSIPLRVHPNCQCVTQPTVTPKSKTQTLNKAAPVEVPPDLAEKNIYQWFDQDKIRAYGFDINDYGDAVPGGYNYKMVAKTPEGEIMGRLEVNMETATQEGVIGLVEVEEKFRRQGVATKMLDWMRRYEPDLKLEWGYTTDDGAALRNALPERWR